MFWKKTIALVFISCIALLPSFSQKTIVTGQVKDGQSGQVLPGVTIYTSTNNAVNTDENGSYFLGVSPGNVTIKTRYVGFKEWIKVITIPEGETMTLNISLQPQATELGTVVVSAGKFEQKVGEVTVSMSVMTPKTIECMANLTLESAIEQVSGVSIIDGQANIRGGSGYSYGAGSRVLVLVDDVPMLSADANDVKWSFLPIENLEQVEVVKGASSALYGSSAMNGIINFRTFYAKSEPVTRLTSYSGIYDVPSRKVTKWWGKNMQLINAANFLHAQKLGQLDLVIGSHYLLDDGFRKGETEKRVRANINTRYRFKKADGLSAGVNANYMETFGGLFFIWNDDTTGANIPLGGVDDTTSTLSNYHTIRYNIDPFITYGGKKGFTARIRSRYFNTSNYNDTQQEAFAELFYGELQLQQRIEKWDFTATGGITYTDNGVRSDLYSSRKSYNRSLYAQLDKKFFDRITLSAGGRWEQFRFRYEGEQSKPVFRAGANIRVFKATYMRGSYGQGYRFPSIAEKYIRTQVGSIVIYPNDSISSETGWTAEAGIRQEFAFGKFLKGYADVCIFRSKYHGMIEFEFGKYGQSIDPFSGLGFKSVNIGNTKIDGIESELGIELSINKNLSVLLGGGYTYIEPVYTHFDSLIAERGTTTFNILKYRSRNLLKANGEIRFKKLSFGIATRYNSFMQNIDAVFNILITGVEDYRKENEHGDWVYDANLEYAVNKNLSVAIVSRNLFNTEYADRPAILEEPRVWMFKFTLRN